MDKLEKEVFFYFTFCNICKSEHLKIYEKDTEQYNLVSIKCLDCGHKEIRNWRKFYQKGIAEELSKEVI